MSICTTYYIYHSISFPILNYFSVSNTYNMYTYTQFIARQKHQQWPHCCANSTGDWGCTFHCVLSDTGAACLIICVVTTSGSASSGVLGEVGGGASSRIINRINGSTQEHLRAVWGQQLPLIYATVAFLFVGRRLCVYTFPALFRIHKTHSGGGSQMRSFMGFLGFLDRKVENSLILASAFWSIVCSILCSSTKVFL